MVKADIKENFIELRAQNNSLESIAKQLGISKPTVLKMNRELELEINRLKLINFEALAVKYKMVRSARIEGFGKLLERLDTALESVDLNRMTPVQLIELRFKVADRLKAELEFKYLEPGLGSKNFDDVTGYLAELD